MTSTIIFALSILQSLATLLLSPFMKLVTSLPETVQRNYAYAHA